MLYPKDRLVRVAKGEELVIEWKRKPADGIALTIIGLLCIACMFVTTNTPLNDGSERSLGDKLGMIGILLTIGLPFIYYGLGFLFNTTRIIATKHIVTRTVRPIPMAKDIAFRADDLKQFFVSRFQASAQNSTASSQSIYVMDSEQHVHLFASALPSSFASYQVQHELQDFYGLEDLPVYGVTTDPAHPGPR